MAGIAIAKSDPPVFNVTSNDLGNGDPRMFDYLVEGTVDNIYRYPLYFCPPKNHAIFRFLDDGGKRIRLYKDTIDKGNWIELEFDFRKDEALSKVQITFQNLKRIRIGDS